LKKEYPGDIWLGSAEELAQLDEEIDREASIMERFAV